VPGARVLAPDDFWRILPRLHRYPHALAPGAAYEWVLVHKGEMQALRRNFLEEVASRGRAVFANEVFVLFDCSGAPADPPVPPSDHLEAFRVLLAGLPETPPAPGEGPVLPEPDVVSRFEALDDAGLRRAMDGFWQAGGYRYETLRDRTYCAEIDSLLTEHAGPCEGLAVLDLCCGTGRLGRLMPRAGSVLGIDISAVALTLARQRHAALPQFRFAQMPAECLALPECSFDVVLFVDAIEHVRNAAAALAETARVLRPGGLLFATVANRDSLNQRLTRRLGYPEFVTNYQHIREFGWAETRGMLAAAGLVPARADGIFLYPYWGVPGLDQSVRALTDDDPEIVEAMRDLGRRAGPDYAYAIAVSARKPSPGSARAAEPRA
jgi:SAM-dependent methyltransferase